MKLAVAVLSSILLACSVTIANPIDPSATTDVESIAFPDLPSATTDVESSIFPDLPSATTDVESSTLPTPNPNGIGLGGLDPLPDSIKDLFKKYRKKKQGFNQQKKKCELLKSEYNDQRRLIERLWRNTRILQHKYQGNGGSPKHDATQKSKLNLKAQRDRLDDLKESIQDCESKRNSLEFELDLIEIELVTLVFGGPWDPKSFYKKLLLIGTYPSVQNYLDRLRNEEKSSECNECLGQNPSDQQQHRKPSGQQQQQKPGGQQQQQKPSDQQQQQKPSDQQQQQKPSDQQQHQKPSGQQQHQEPQPSPDTPSGSGSPGQKVPSNRQKGSSKFMGKLKSFFG
ncbi:hypothetical protein BATDEDRAFT_86370 [Batrachochytrium dendrobatidis JAM81]|uniref:Uncharacterized protein n=1 Tax=Batrachochytrium dendrobatidis (strain JAM81 / FGSC 10211) TaxID=684364 RepID=F4NWY7_BATDJ|nr:uncharacterized protein BATDEDRAFT_86370 [Batrachochytrium dendrobatidis JAM81]EGF82899.1 hypothetical protein BATDEDRAFT_86370 [Batrachochytrium dendrobatidis JAM81]|eukprot:XP_006677090.1 hypothetical protein BATDEDRAFT_86370 [Batrachochytrium dendrobatidis JAM81]